MNSVLASLALGFGLAFSESGLGLGMIIPAETGVVVLAATMPTGSALLLLGIAVALGACLGDHIGYGLGLRHGDRLRESKLVSTIGRRHFDRATSVLHKHGGRAVFITRLMPVIRTLVPAAAGAAHLEYRRFLPASLAGSTVWATVYVGGGTVIGSTSDWLYEALGRAAWLVAAIVVLVLLPLFVVRRVVTVRPAAEPPEVERFEHRRRSDSGRRPRTALVGEFRTGGRAESQLELVTR